VRFMTWLLGVLVLVAWHTLSLQHGAPADSTFGFAVFVWCLVGLGALTAAIVRTVSAKIKAGSLSMPGASRPGAPVHREEG